MSIMIDTESVTDAEVREYMTSRGTTIGQMFVEYLKEAIRRDRLMLTNPRSLSHEVS